MVTLSYLLITQLSIMMMKTVLLINSKQLKTQILKTKNIINWCWRVHSRIQLYVLKSSIISPYSFKTLAKAPLNCTFKEIKITISDIFLLSKVFAFLTSEYLLTAISLFTISVMRILTIWVHHSYWLTVLMDKLVKLSLW